MAIDLEEIKKRALARMKNLDGNLGSPVAELATVQLGQSFEEKQQIAKATHAARVSANKDKEIADEARDLFSDLVISASSNAGVELKATGTTVPTTASASLASAREAAGIVDDGGAAARATIASYKAKQGLQASINSASARGAVDRKQLEALKATVNSQAYEVPEELRKIEGLNAELFMANLLSVEQGVKSSGENIQDYLRLIHANLTQFPELTHLLNDEQIALIVQGFIYESKEQVAIATKRGSKSVRQLTAGRSHTDILDMLDMKL